MKKSTIGVGLCLLLALAVTGSKPTAQVVPANDTMAGEGLDKSAEDFVAAMNAADHDAIFNALAPWKQNAVALVMERMSKAIESGELTEEKAKKLLKNGDPSGSLGMKTLEDLKAAPPAKLWALQSGMAAFATEILSKKKGTSWYMTERLVGLQQPRRNIEMLPWGGFARFENSDGDLIELHLSLKGAKWYVVDYGITSGTRTVTFRSALHNATGAPREWTNPQQARAAEGEQLLGSARDHARVEYAKSGTAAGAQQGLEKEITVRRTFEGRYYSVKAIFVDIPGSEFDAVITAHPKNEDDPWLYIEFNWASGKSEITWSDDEEQFNERIEALKKAE